MSLKYRKLNNGDYVMGTGKNNFVSGTLAVSQAIKTRLLLLKGEWWEDIQQGYPLFQNVLNQRANAGNKIAVDLLTKDVIGKTIDVLRINKFESTVNTETRTYTVNCNVETIYGDAKIIIVF